jgi:hypothetical protein
VLPFLYFPFFYVLPFPLYTFFYSTQRGVERIEGWRDKDKVDLLWIFLKKEGERGEKKEEEEAAKKKKKKVH